MPAEQFEMHHPDVTVPGTTTQAAYDAVWFDRGWRKRPTERTKKSAGTTEAVTPEP